MNETAERVAVACPSCAPGSEVVHEVLSPGNGHATVRCTECGHTHKVSVESEDRIEVDVVISQDGDSFTARTAVPGDEELAVGDEFVVDAPEAIMQVRITSIEVGDEQRSDRARAEDVQTLWTRAVDNVRVPVSIHPKDGNRDQTRSVTMAVPGDEEFAVGETRSAGDEEFEIVGIQVRADADGYRFEKFDHDGDVVFAKDVKRLYARDESSTAWSAW
jgi:predicted Zn finger-like uncharacterized protein